MITLISNGVAYQLSLVPHGPNSAAVRVNGHDYPIAFDAEDGDLKVAVWKKAHVDQPTATFVLDGFH